MEVRGLIHTAAALHPWDRELGTYWMGSWGGHRASLGGVEERKTSCPAGNQTLIPLPSSL
jgi:hypothetical protein